MSEFVWQRTEDADLIDFVYSGKSDIHGTGLFSRQKINEGEYIGTFHGPQVMEDGDHVLWIEKQKNSEEYIGIRGTNILRFLNHDQDANAEFHGLDLYASKDIPKNSEITLDYGG